MNKILKGACIVAMVALAFTSCKKNDNKNLTFIATAEEVTVMNDEDRAYLDPAIASTPIFEQGEQVMLYNIYEEGDVTPHSYYGVYTARTTGPRVLFDYQSGPIVYHTERQDDGAFFGFYPGQRVNNAFLAQSNVAVFDIPTVQIYREINGKGVCAERSWAMAAKTATVDDIEDEFYFNFRNIMGALCLKPRTNGEQKTVTSIVFEDKTFNITGDVHLKIHEINPDEMLWLFNNYNPASDTYMQRLNQYITATGYFVDGNKGKTITLDCGEGVVIDGTGNKPFYIVLRPLAWYNGCIITFNFADGTKAIIDNNLSRTMAPNMVRNITTNVDNYMVP